MGDSLELRSLLARVRRRWLALVLLGTSARAALAAALPLAAVALATWLLAPSDRILVPVAGAGVLASLAAAAFVVAQMQRRPDDRRVARFVEERLASEEIGRASCEPDALVSAVQMADARDDSGPFGRLVIAQALTALRRVEPGTVIRGAALRRAAAQACAAAAVLVAALALALPHLLRAGAMTWGTLFPASIEIAVLTGDTRVAAGQPLRLAATVQGRAARLLSIVPSLVVAADGQERAVPMSASPDGFSYSFESVDRSFRYQVAAGGARSSAYTVTALFPPRVTRIDLQYQYPAFSGLAARKEEDGGDVYGPAGTKVSLLIHADKPIAQGAVALASGTRLPLTSTGQTATADLVVAGDDGYRVKLTDADGLQAQSEVEYFIRVMDDRPPDIRIVRPASDQGITPLEEILIEARADDDHGVASMELVYAVAGREPRTVPLSRITGTAVARLGSHLLAAEELDVRPGDVITYYARARDVARGKPSTVSRSDIFFLEVKPFNEEFVSAQSQAMGGGGAGNQIDSLIAAQKEIINATWNLERRSGAGRSAEDLKAVGDAQAELKARVEGMLSGGRRGARSTYPPQQIDRPSRRGQTYPGADPVGAAASAMGRAVEQLQQARTAEAIPHEMTALQGLLQAQAEVRRREVMRQSASGAGQGGTNRSDRDLSALFDRELQRQQRTNYETPKESTAVARDDQDSSDALDRVRDLARRQEELARRQRALADNQHSDEAERELERLTREQEELKNQAEALEKQLREESRRAGSEGARSGAAGAAATGRDRSARDMRQVSEQMRAAAREMERQNAAGAAATGNKAAEALRQLERQIQGNTTNARQRAAGELRLEAQEVAEAQRRVADEVARLERDGQTAAKADALRRLAGEKSRLADRVENLRRDAEQVRRDTPGDAGAAFGRAARQLQEQRVSERMRKSAGQLKEMAPPSGASARAGGTVAAGSRAELEHELSRALDSVVKTLGGGDPQSGAEQLTDELARTQELRDRLERLEAQVREAEAKAKATGDRATAEGRASAEQAAQRARQEYGGELQRARQALERSSSVQPRGLSGGTPEQHEYSRSAPGNEAFKQDFSNWKDLRRDVERAIEHHEAAVSARLARKIAEDRLSGGGSERVPESYRDLVSRYFESIAKPKP